jgi:hypothetical protein
MLRLQDFSPTVQPNDARRTLKRTQHDDNAPVLSQMRNRLGAATDVIQIRESVGVKDAKRVESLWRQVDVTARTQWTCGDKEHPLGSNELSKGLIDLFVDLTHCAF